jgi:hypothetical protein
VTDMLKRVYAGANSAEEYSAAHNAAFSLARLYGHVTERSIVEVRRPSRDPDAPSEQALASWVETLPGLPGPSQGPQIASIGPASPAPAELLGPGSNVVSRQHPGPEPCDTARDVDATQPQHGSGPEVKASMLSMTYESAAADNISAAAVDWLAEGPDGGRAGIGNGAPSSPGPS